MDIRSRRAFTLIEATMVIVMIGVLTTISIPVFTTVFADSNNQSAQQSLKLAQVAARNVAGLPVNGYTYPATATLISEMSSLPGFVSTTTSSTTSSTTTSTTTTTAPATTTTQVTFSSTFSVTTGVSTGPTVVSVDVLSSTTILMAVASPTSACYLVYDNLTPIVSGNGSTQSGTGWAVQPAGTTSPGACQASLASGQTSSISGTFASPSVITI